MTDTVSLAVLPGPRRHIARLAAELDAGRGCVWLVPDVLVDSGDVQELLCELESHVDGFRIPNPIVDRVVQRLTTPTVSGRGATDPAPSWARARFDLLRLPDELGGAEETTVTRATTSIAQRALSLLDPGAESAGDPLADLISAEDLHGKVLTLLAWNEPDPHDVGAFLVRFAAMTKDLAVPPPQRVRLLVVARERDLPETTLERVDPVTTSVCWWWGVVGRLDTAVVIAEAQPVDPTGQGMAVSAHDVVVNDVIAEIAGPDLRLAEHLSSSWNGRIGSLTRHVTEYVDEMKTTLDEVTGRRDGNNRPPQRLLRAWAAGFADRWDGDVRISPAAMSGQYLASELDQLVWRGQARALNPVVDRLRIALERKIKSSVSSAAWTELISIEERNLTGRSPGAQPARTVLEFTRMVWAVRTGLVRLSRPDSELLYCLRDTRNALAHMVSLTDTDLDELTRVLGRSTDLW